MSNTTETKTEWSLSEDAVMSKAAEFDLTLDVSEDWKSHHLGNKELDVFVRFQPREKVEELFRYVLYDAAEVERAMELVDQWKALVNAVDEVFWT